MCVCVCRKWRWPTAVPAHPLTHLTSVSTDGPTSTRRPPSRKSSASFRAAPLRTPLPALTPVWRELHQWVCLSLSPVPTPCSDPWFHYLPTLKGIAPLEPPWAEANQTLLRKWLSLLPPSGPLLTQRCQARGSMRRLLCQALPSGSNIPCPRLVLDTQDSISGLLPKSSQLE